MVSKGQRRSPFVSNEGLELALSPESDLRKRPAGA